ncbi:MAG: hypothetical protein ACLQG5_11975 [Methanobacterium sp.]|jgi:Ni,Fe-hydrogenase III large subunit
MRLYSYDGPSGRKIGEIGDYTLYSETLVREKSVIKPYVTKESNTAFNFIYGPSTGGLIESTLFNILTTGESIKGMTSDPMFKLRELKVLGKNVKDAMPIIERINGSFTASHSIAFLGAVEDAMEIELDEYILMGRIIELELERIRNHLHVIARMCEAAAFGVPYNNLFYMREKINRLIEEYSGHRFFHNVNRIGEIDIDLIGVSKSLENICNDAKNTYDSLRDSKIFVDRLLDNGVVKDLDCIGPVARGCGYPYDARVDSTTLPYTELGFSPVIEKGKGDAMDRFIIRFEEIQQSTEIIGEAEKRLKKHTTRPYHMENEGEGLGRVESPSGDLTYLIKLNEGKINEISMLTPSKVNLPVFLNSTRGNVFTDFHFNWESFGIWISEIAVGFI